MTLTHHNAFRETCSLSITLTAASVSLPRHLLVIRVSSHSRVSFSHSLKACVQHPVINIWFVCVCACGRGGGCLQANGWLLYPAARDLNHWGLPISLMVRFRRYDSSIVKKRKCANPVVRGDLTIGGESIQGGSRQTIELFEGGSHFLSPTLSCSEELHRLHITHSLPNLVGAHFPESCPSFLIKLDEQLRCGH